MPKKHKEKPLPGYAEPFQPKSEADITLETTYQNGLIRQTITPEIGESLPTREQITTAMKTGFRFLQEAREYELQCGLDSLHSIYLETSNPLAAWDAYQLARKKKVPVPEWVMEYLDRSACNLLAPNRLDDVGHCLELKPKTKPKNSRPFSQYDTSSKHRAAVLAVKYELLFNHTKVESACEAVAERLNEDFLTIKHWYNAAD